MRNIVCYDVETTGLSTQTDKVIQLSAVKFNEDFEIIGQFDEYIRPIGEWFMSEGAEEVHGISTKFIMENGKLLKDVGAKFLEFIEDCDILSYNGNRFDIKILTLNLREVGLDLQIDGRVFFDSYLLETKLQSRKLGDVYKRYTGKDLEGAHNALNDVIATVEVFRHQVVEFGNAGYDMDQIMGFEEIKILSIDGMIKRSSNPNEPEEIVFAKGKYKDVDFMDVIQRDPGYIKWFMENKDFDIHTKNVLREYYAKNRHKLNN
jgi:DNA polymerase-3 subunit epsilon